MQRKIQPGDPLDPRQKEVHAYILRYFRKFGESPTRQQIQHAFGFRSPNAAQDLVMKLVAKGALSHTPGKFRGIIPHSLPSEVEAQPIAGGMRYDRSGLSW